jgi:hypothetical protein
MQGFLVSVSRYQRLHASPLPVAAEIQKNMIATRKLAVARSRPPVLRPKAMVPTPPIMEAAKMEVIQRVARVLAGQYFCRNAAGAAGDDNASILVDQNWIDFQDDAIAVLKTLRTPPDTIRSDPEIAVWAHIIQTALGSHAHSGV